VAGKNEHDESQCAEKRLEHDATLCLQHCRKSISLRALPVLAKNRWLRIRRMCRCCAPMYSSPKRRGLGEPPGPVHVPGAVDAAAAATRSGGGSVSSSLAYSPLNIAKGFLLTQRMKQKD
jgi:hypothetical protein